MGPEQGVLTRRNRLDLLEELSEDVDNLAIFIAVTFDGTQKTFIADSCHDPVNAEAVRKHLDETYQDVMSRLPKQA